MTKVHAAMLLQLRWRHFKALRVKSLCKKVNLLNAGKAKGAAEDHYGEGHGDVLLGGGWVKRTSKKTGEAYYLHTESGKSQWEAPTGDGV